MEEQSHRERYRHLIGQIMANTDELMTFEHVDLGYGRNKIVTDLNMSLQSGDFLGIVGPNGCGKTTLLKAMLGILRPMNGQIKRNTEVRFGYVPQRQFIDEVYPLTVQEVAVMGRYPLIGPFGRPSRADKDIVMESLNHVGIADLANRPYRELSGGQKQRSLIARALAAQPQALILDEPTNDMDIASEHSIMELLQQLHKNDGITIVMVSHLLNVVCNYARKLALICGETWMIGAIEQILTSKSLSSVYGIPVEVTTCNGRTVILTGGSIDA
jgi:ABC-type cobalamin/Fe3+-siderophores transport system ATPase subunit